MMMGDDVIKYDPDDIENDDDDERRDMIVRTKCDVNTTTKSTTSTSRGVVPDNDASRTSTILYCASVSILLNVTFLIVIVGMIMMMLMDGHPSPPLYNTTSMMTSRSNNSTTPSVSSVAVNVVTTSSLPSSRDCISGNGSSSGSSTTPTTTTTTTPTTTTITTPTSDSNEQLRLRLQEKYLVTNVTRGVVASDQSICSQMAMERILQPYNGTAVDAAIFIALCLGVVNPASSGLGGGAFVLLHHTFNDDTHDNDDDDSSSNHSQQFYDARTTPTTNHKTTQQNHNKNRKVNEVIDCRERAPMNANATMYHNLPPNASVYGTLAIPIMGELHCLSLAHARFGTVPWSTIVQPVIDMAMTDGIVVGSYLARQIHDTATHHIKLQQQDPYQLYYNRYFVNPR